MTNFLLSLEMDTLFNASKFFCVGELLENYPIGSKFVTGLRKESV